MKPQVFDVLVYLIAHRDEVVTKNDLLDNVWGDRFVSESALTARIKEVRRAIGDSGRSQALLRTIHGRGFRWIAPTERIDEGVDDEPGRGSVSPTARPVGGARSRPLPRSVELLGRVDAVDSVVDALREGRLVTIVGPGGVGKTTLAVEVARQVADDHPGGVVLCEFAALGDGDTAAAVLDTIAGSAGSGDGTPEQIVAAVGDDPTLLIFDNCEHVVEEVAKLVGHILDLADRDQISVLTTTREALDVQGERIVRLEGLSWEHDDDPGVELFLRRSRDASAEIDSAPDTMAAVREIVRRVDGFPLAIEMAAARLTSTTPTSLAGSLRHSVLELGSRRRFDERQSSVGRTVSWSVDLLSPGERHGIVDPGIFPGSFTAAAAAAILDDDPDHLLHRLVEQSLLTVATSRDAVRYRLFEPTRQYVSGLLDDERRAVLAERHARYFADLGIRLGEALWTTDASAASARLSEEWNDLGRALAWGREHRDVRVAIDPLLALGLHLQWQLRTEGFRWPGSGLEGVEIDPDREPQVTDMTAMAAVMDRDFGRTRELLRGATRPAARSVMLVTGILSGDAEMLAAATSDRDDVGISEPWRMIGRAHRLIAQSFVEPQADATRGLADGVRGDLEPRSGVPAPDLWALLALLTYSIRTGDLEPVGPLRAEIDRISAATGLRWFSTLVAGMTKSADETGAERVGVRQALMHAKAVVMSKDGAIIPWALRTLVIELHAAGHAELAAKMIGVLDANDEISSYERGMSVAFERAATDIRQHRLDGPTFDRLVAEGRHMSLLDGLGDIDRALGGTFLRADGLGADSLAIFRYLIIVELCLDAGQERCSRWRSASSARAAVPALTVSTGSRSPRRSPRARPPVG